MRVRFEQGLIEAATRKPDLVILDLGCRMAAASLPDSWVASMNPDAVYRLSARTEETDKIAALDGGAGNYLVKPLALANCRLAARVAMRRHSAHHIRRPNLHVW